MMGVESSSDYMGLTLELFQLAINLLIETSKAKLQVKL